MDFDFVAGEILLIDKPLRWTSFDVVAKLRHAIRKSLGLRKFKVGHAGTLDPLASGLLIICTGKKTKTIQDLMGLEKEYTGKIYLGATTPSYDLETEIDTREGTEGITLEDVVKKSTHFLGAIEQMPPRFSAKKIDGKRAYEHARKGEDPELKSVTVTVKSFEISADVWPEVKFKIVCSKGTYIRSLAHDLGRALGCGAHLTELRRTRIGEFSVDQSLNPISLAEQINPTANYRRSEEREDRRFGGKC